MPHSLKFGVAAMVAVFGGGSFYLGAAEAPAFAQATGAGSTGQAATRGTTGGAAQPQRRVNRPRPGGAGSTDVRGGQGRPGSPTTADPVPLTAAECTSLGGQVIAVSGLTCPRLNGPDGGGQICSVVYHGTSPDGQPLTDRRDTCITSLR
jgi:hypothetical protein